MHFYEMWLIQVLLIFYTANTYHEVKVQFTVVLLNLYLNVCNLSLLVVICLKSDSKCFWWVEKNVNHWQAIKNKNKSNTLQCICILTSLFFLAQPKNENKLVEFNPNSFKLWFLLLYILRIRPKRWSNW